MSKHTPGPWAVETGSFTDEGDVQYALKGVKLLNSLDARLIAAAPDGLRLAYSVLWFANQYPSQITFAMRGLVDDAKALIAKVETE